MYIYMINNYKFLIIRLTVNQNKCNYTITKLSYNPFSVKFYVLLKIFSRFYKFFFLKPEINFPILQESKVKFRIITNDL